MSTVLSAIVAALGVAINPPCGCGATPLPEPRFRVGLSAVRSTDWELEIRTGDFLNRRASYRAGWSAGILVGVDPVRQASLIAAFHWNGGGLGDTSGWSFWEVGAEVRAFSIGRIQAKGITGIGRASETGGVDFGLAMIGVGADLALGRRFVGSISGRLLEPFSPRDGRHAGSTARINGQIGQVTMGMSIRL